MTIPSNLTRRAAASAAGIPAISTLAYLAMDYSLQPLHISMSGLSGQDGNSEEVSGNSEES